MTGPETVSQRVRAYQGFTQQILSGAILPGQFISQRELMTLLDMPLGAVREMIPRLEAGGLIKTVPQRGLQIAHVDLKLIRNAFQVRSMIEREAVLAFVQSASDSELAAIEAGAQDFEPGEEAGATMFWTDAADLDLVSRALPAHNFSVLTAKLGYKPKNPVNPENLTAEQLEEVETFLAAIDGNDDVQNVFVGLAN
jgi:DNA-binding transcriptional MocR family regulator